MTRSEVYSAQGQSFTMKADAMDLFHAAVNLYAEAQRLAYVYTASTDFTGAHPSRVSALRKELMSLGLLEALTDIAFMKQIAKQTLEGGDLEALNWGDANLFHLTGSTGLNIIEQTAQIFDNLNIN